MTETKIKLKPNIGKTKSSQNQHKDQNENHTAWLAILACGGSTYAEWYKPVKMAQWWKQSQSIKSLAIITA